MISSCGLVELGLSTRLASVLTSTHFSVPAAPRCSQTRRTAIETQINPVELRPNHRGTSDCAQRQKAPSSISPRQQPDLALHAVRSCAQGVRGVPCTSSFAILLVGRRALLLLLDSSAGDERTRPRTRVLAGPSRIVPHVVDGRPLKAKCLGGGRHASDFRPCPFCADATPVIVTIDGEQRAYALA